jgi:hypothetical protein
MNRLQRSLILIAAIAVPAAAHSTFAPAPDRLCLANGASSYRIADNAATADVRIRMADAAERPDLRMQLVDRAEIADFVLVDDSSGQAPAGCRSATPLRSVTLDAGPGEPDVTVHLSAAAGASDYKIYVHSARFSHQDAAALFAAMWKTGQPREVTGSLR